MEIYKLGEKIQEGSSDFEKSQRLQVTNLKQGIKNPNRVNVFINSKYEFSLDLTQVVDFKLKVGSIISEEELLEYKKASEFGKLYQRALEWVLLRPRSEKELSDYLYKKLRTSISETLGSARRYGRAGAHSLPVGRESSSIDVSEFSLRIIERLKSHGYIDDFKFAEWYVENRFVKKGVSQKRLKMELLKKGISKDVIEEVLRDSGRSDEEEILKIIAKKRAKYDDEKLTQYLCRQGFAWQLASELVRSYEKD